MKTLIMLFSSILLFISCSRANKSQEPKKSYAEVNGTKLYYEIAGNGEPLVLVHGNFGDCRHWDYNYEELAKEFKVIRYDVRGYGKSNSSPKGYEYKDHGDLKALLDYLGIPKVHIAGFSMGSGIVINFALEYPEMCTSLISVGPWVCGYSPPSINEFSSDFGRIPLIIEQGGTDAAAEELIEFPIFKAHVSSQDVKNFITHNAKDYSFLHWIGEGPTRIEPNAVNMLDQIKVPTLIMTSEYDINACLEVADLLQEKISGSKLVRIPKATHFMMMDNPEEFNRNVINFITGI
ncbi:MAG: alpha/beta hydrolase [Bacteroidales bacterium]|nr:alpha/beta hydrolase [Bacteroidales bacterium]